MSAELHEQQVTLIRALLDGGPAPEGVRRDRLEALSEGLIRRRVRLWSRRPGWFQRIRWRLFR